MISRNRVAEHAQYTRALDIFHRTDIERELLEIRRMMNVRRVLVPFIQIAAGNLDVFPHIRAAEHVGVSVPEHFSAHARRSDFVDLLLRGPQVFQENRRAVRTDAERFFIEVNIHSPRERVGDDKRRTR